MGRRTTAFSTGFAVDGAGFEAGVAPLTDWGEAAGGGGSGGPGSVTCPLSVGSDGRSTGDNFALVFAFSDPASARSAATPPLTQTPAIATKHIRPSHFILLPRKLDTTQDEPYPKPGKVVVLN